MVLTLSRQFVTLTGTGKAVRVFFSYSSSLKIIFFASQTAHFSVKRRNAIFTSRDVISSDDVNHPAVTKHVDINRVMGNQIFDVTMNNFPRFYSLQKNFIIAFTKVTMIPYIKNSPNQYKILCHIFNVTFNNIIICTPGST